MKTKAKDVAGIYPPHHQAELPLEEIEATGGILIFPGFDAQLSEIRDFARTHKASSNRETWLDSHWLETLIEYNLPHCRAAGDHDGALLIAMNIGRIVERIHARVFDRHVQIGRGMKGGCKKIRDKKRAKTEANDAAIAQRVAELTKVDMRRRKADRVGKVKIRQVVADEFRIDPRTVTNAMKRAGQQN